MCRIQQAELKTTHPSIVYPLASHPLYIPACMGVVTWVQGKQTVGPSNEHNLVAYVRHMFIIVHQA